MRPPVHATALPRFRTLSLTLATTLLLGACAADAAAASLCRRATSEARPGIAVGGIIGT